MWQAITLAGHQFAFLAQNLQGPARVFACVDEKCETLCAFSKCGYACHQQLWRESTNWRWLVVMGITFFAAQNMIERHSTTFRFPSGFCNLKHILCIWGLLEYWDTPESSKIKPF